MHQKDGHILSYKRGLFIKLTCYELGESVEIQDDHFSPDALTREKALRDHRWSEAMAVGSSAFVNKIKSEPVVNAMHREVHFRSER
jgi:hypothetical protein